jgi:hypothetical protein
MKKFCITALAFAIITLITAKAGHAQMQSAPEHSQSASIVVSVGMDKDHVPVGQSPFAVLTIENHGDGDIVVHDTMVRLYVEDEKGERPTTIAQRTITGKFRPDDQPLRTDEMSEWRILPGDISQHRYEVSHFYDIGSPGSYKLCIEVSDPSSHKWLRTKAVQFEIQRKSQ